MQDVSVRSQRVSGELRAHTRSVSTDYARTRPSDRRELAAREHIVAHDPGKGQQAFAPNRRDMNAYRAELEKQRLDRIQKEASEAASGTSDPSSTMSSSEDSRVDARAIPSLSTSAPAPTPIARPAPPAPSNPLANLRISQPLAGLRVAVPRPVPMARPTPGSVSNPAPATTEPPASASTNGETQAEPDSATTSDARPEATAVATNVSHVADPAESEPLLSSHVCSSYFVEPLSWMSPFLETGALAGKIVCPNKKCNAKLGNFDWAGNRQFLYSFSVLSLPLASSVADVITFSFSFFHLTAECSCGAWVCPGFALNVSRVDEIKV